ncbi:MAG: hypothetical protein DI535_09105 [Citrobacter freundii]|nr:MAG: hypothetical protein DI535_09105 [Citrobacter freundii]
MLVVESWSGIGSFGREHFVPGLRRLELLYAGQTPGMTGKFIADFDPGTGMTRQFIRDRNDAEFIQDLDPGTGIKGV